MNFDTYSALKSAIAEELNRDDLDSAIPGFIALCEAQTERQLRTRQMLTSNSAFTIDSEFEALPTDFLETRAIYLPTNPVTELQFETIDSLLTLKMTHPGVGKPFAFSVIGNSFQFVKVPDMAYQATLLYYAKIPRLSDTTASNWLLASSPDIYFYGSLLNSAPYLKEDVRLDLWATLYQNAVDALKVADDRAKTASNNLRMRARTF